MAQGVSFLLSSHVIFSLKLRDRQTQDAHYVPGGAHVGAGLSHPSGFFLNPHNNGRRYQNHFINEETYHMAENLVQTHTKSVDLGSEAVIFHPSQDLTFNGK